MLLERDWIEWTVDLGGAVGGFASLLAVIVGFVALRMAHTDRKEFASARESNERARRRAETVALLKMLQSLDDDLRRMDTYLGQDVFESSQREARSKLAAFGVRDALPITRTFADSTYDGWGDSSPALLLEARDRARREVAAFIQSESEKAHDRAKGEARERDGT